MSQYKIKLNYRASFTTTVNGDFRNEGDAFDAARAQAEEADMDEFVIESEMPAQILEAR